MFRSLSLWLHCYSSKHCSSYFTPLSLLFLCSLSLSPQSPSLHMCVCTSWICLKGEEGGIKSAERTWQLLVSLSLHCFGPPQILFHGAKHPLPGISTTPISRRRFKPLSWHPDWARIEEACDAHQHRQNHINTPIIFVCSPAECVPSLLQQPRSDKLHPVGPDMSWEVTHL